ncbi:hypothetical protein SS50377_26817 [Spironucleus salmonicida]|uniref:Uncharacterized protein n=1 Tax=Spironucleus salmonicida TaxID=348837 RepID=V6LZV1_9EUKA|nr:hypothetical protein SS50377_26817 [Spironucleus salmonicida]|eukprot:EST49286.1 Hypothetical protein SS50377_10509 [Spironucleus salmonicida]
MLMINYLSKYEISFEKAAGYYQQMLKGHQIINQNVELLIQELEILKDMSTKQLQNQLNNITPMIRQYAEYNIDIEKLLRENLYSFVESKNYQKQLKIHVQELIKLEKQNAKKQDNIKITILQQRGDEILRKRLLFERFKIKQIYNFGYQFEKIQHLIYTHAEINQNFILEDDIFILNKQITEDQQIQLVFSDIRLSSNVNEQFHTIISDQVEKFTKDHIEKLSNDIGLSDWKHGQKYTITREVFE